MKRRAKIRNKIRCQAYSSQRTVKSLEDQRFEGLWNEPWPGGFEEDSGLPESVTEQDSRRFGLISASIPLSSCRSGMASTLRKGDPKAVSPPLPGLCHSTPRWQCHLSSRWTTASPPPPTCPTPRIPSGEDSRHTVTEGGQNPRGVKGLRDFRTGLGRADLGRIQRMGSIKVSGFLAAYDNRSSWRLPPRCSAPQRQASPHHWSASQDI
jgi:hypothetical protein